MLMLYLRQRGQIVWPVSAGAPEPAFSNYSRTFNAWVKLQQRIFPTANKLALALIVCAALAGWFGFQIPAIVLWAVGCGGYTVAYIFVELKTPKPIGL